MPVGHVSPVVYAVSYRVTATLSPSYGGTFYVGLVCTPIKRMFNRCATIKKCPRCRAVMDATSDQDHWARCLVSVIQMHSALFRRSHCTNHRRIQHVFNAHRRIRFHDGLMLSSASRACPSRFPQKHADSRAQMIPVPES